MQIGVAVGVVDESIHIITTNGIGNKVDIVGGAGVFSYYNHIGDMVVVPVVVAVEPESRPEPRTWGEWIPIESVAVHHVMMAWVHEVWCGVHGTMRGRHRTVGVAGTCISASRSRSHSARTAVCHIATGA